MRAMAMTTHIGLLRAINLGPLNRVAMKDLCALLTRLELHDPRSLLQSGNVVFGCDARTPVQLEQALEKATKERLGVETDYFVRTAKEWRAIIAANPFPKEARADPARLILMCLKDAPDRAAVTALQEAIVGREVVRASGRQAYFLYPDGQGRSKLTIKLIEKKLGTRGTARNWNTVLKLGALAET
jgi:uncharacterized protein (DUF1697 family)